MEKLRSKTKIAKYLLIIISFMQTNWVPIACGAAVVAAAASFGDKSYMMQLGKDAQALMAEGNNAEAIEMLESKITEYDIWRQDNLDNDNLKSIDEGKFELYYQLAVAKEKTGFSQDQVKDAYILAIGSRSDGVVFSKLYSLLPEQEYKNLVLKTIEDSRKTHKEKKVNLNIRYNEFVESNNWSAFKTFIDVLFDNVDEPARYAQSISSFFKSNESWSKEFLKYCETKPRLLEFVLEEDYKQAKEYLEQENFIKAALVYEGIINKSKPTEMDVSELELKTYECYFNGGDYQKVIPKLEEFISSHKAAHRNLVKEALLMKGRAHIQLGEIDKAANEFLSLMIEYPETKNAPEANFFIGYCYMLQGKFDLAKDSMNMVISDYPSSSFASKARLCIIRINSMTE